MDIDSMLLSDESPRLSSVTTRIDVERSSAVFTELIMIYIASEKNMLTVLEVAYEMYARGIKILPVDIYESDAKEFKVVGEKQILPPMIALQGVGENAAIHIQQERENGEFISKEDLQKRTKISKTVIETLTIHGSLDNMSEKNQLSLF